MVYGDGGKGGNATLNGAVGTSGIVILRYLTPPVKTAIYLTSKYLVRSKVPKVKTLQYTIKKAQTISKTLQYSIKAKGILYKDLVYAVKLAIKNKIEVELRYLIKIPSTTISKSIQYLVKKAYTFQPTLEYKIRKPNIVPLLLRHMIRGKEVIPLTLSYFVQYRTYGRNRFNRTKFNRTYFNRLGISINREILQNLLKYTIKAVKPIPLLLEYDVKVVTKKSYDLEYDIYVIGLATHTIELGLAYDMKEKIVRTYPLLLHYLVNTKRVLQLTLGYLIRTYIKTPFDLQYTIVSKQVVQEELVYSILNSVGISLPFKYMIEGEGLPQVRCAYLRCTLDYPKIVHLDCDMEKPKIVNLSCRFICRR